MSSPTIIEPLKALYAPIHGAIRTVKIQFFISLAFLLVSSNLILTGLGIADPLSHARVQAGILLLGFGVYLLNDINRGIQLLNNKKDSAFHEVENGKTPELSVAFSRSHLLVNIQLGTAIFFVFCPSDSFDRWFLMQDAPFASSLCLDSIPVIYAISLWCSLMSVSKNLDRACKD